MVTRKEVAELAGVSPATVSYALTPGRPVSVETRAKVLAAAAQLGYVPNALARGLAGGRARTLAMLIPTSERGVADSDMEYLVGAAEAARALDYQVLLWPMDRTDIAAAARLSRGGLVSGVLLMEVLMNDERLTTLRAEGIPVALIGRTANPEGELYADRDFARVGRLAVKHLAGLGHRKVAFLSAPKAAHDFGLGAVVRSAQGVVDAAAKASIEVNVLFSDHTVAGGREALATMMTAHQGTTAVITFNEEATFGLYHGAAAQRLQIPGDLSVISTSVSEKRATLFYPPLTAISPPALQMGGAAAKALIAKLEGLDIDPGPRLWSGKVVERASTAPPRTVG